jgi:hypothetical protein
MWHSLRSRVLDAMTARRSRRFTTSILAAVILTAGFMHASAPPALAFEYDWYRWRDNWESSRDAGGWDALVLVGYSRGADDYWVNAEFSAYGEHLYVYNATERTADVTLAVEDPVEYKDWVDVSVEPGTCVTWGWDNPPSEFSDCYDLGGRNIPEDTRVVMNVCAQDPEGWICYGEAGES